MNELNFKKMTIDDRELFDSFFKKSQPVISEYTFTNLYAWRGSRQIEYAEYDGGLIILAASDDKKYFLPPVGYKDLKKIYSELLEYGEKKQITNVIKRVNELEVEVIRELGFKIQEDRDNFDYVYLAEDLALLKGRKYSNKRGFVKKFSAEYYHKYYEYTPRCREACLELTEKWLLSRDPDDTFLTNEYNAIKEYLNNSDRLNVVGGVICIDNKVAAFGFGEELNNKTFVVHFEKADIQFMGIYQAINKFFVENEICCKYKYVNREQDLGIPGMRKAKNSYSPSHFNRKYNVYS